MYGKMMEGVIVAAITIVQTKMLPTFIAGGKLSQQSDQSIGSVGFTVRTVRGGMILSRLLVSWL